MDGSSKGIAGAGADKPSPDHDQNASPNVPANPAAAAAGDDGASAAAAAAAAEGRRPFTSLSQEEADLALARVLQEQVSDRDLAAGLVNKIVAPCPDPSPSGVSPLIRDEFSSRLRRQERAYMMLTAQHGSGGEYESSDYDDYDEGEEGSDYEDEEAGVRGALDGDEEIADAAEGAAAADEDLAVYEDDEAFARALQAAEERDVAGRLMTLAGIGDCEFFSYNECGNSFILI